MVKLLIGEIGPVYIKLAVELEEETSNVLLERSKELTYFKKEISLGLKGSRLFLFQFNKNKNDFFISEDFYLLKQFLEKAKIQEIFIVGNTKEGSEEIITKSFHLKHVKSQFIHSTNMLVEGINHICSNYDQVFYDLPGQSIIDLFLVGHKVSMVNEKRFISFKENAIYPFLLVNVYEGTSFYRVQSIDDFKRIGGSTIGMTTYWSLVKLACGYEDPEEAIKDAIKGKNENIDLSVGDIYGGDYSEFELGGALIASAFGKVKKESLENIKKEDISRSLLTFICINVIHLAAYYARIEDLHQIIIVGNSINCLEFQQMMQMAINFFAGGHNINVYFSDYSPYLNLIGTHQKLSNK